MFVVLLSARGKLHGFLFWKSVLGRNIMQDVSLPHTLLRLAAYTWPLLTMHRVPSIVEMTQKKG